MTAERFFAATVTIGGRTLGAGHPALVVAELGVNHDGDARQALALLAAAADAGADAVKVQTFRTEEFLTDRDLTYTYTSGGQTVTEPMFAMFKRLELPLAALRDLQAEAARRRILFLSTPCDTESLQALLALGVPAVKVSSEDLINVRFLAAVAQAPVPVILSTGMADEHEITLALDIFRAAGKRDVVLLHCTSVYPAPDAEVNLARLAALRDRFGILAGYSDHTADAAAAAGAATHGAVLIEKHFTRDRALAGPDHAFSATPAVLRETVAAVRRAEAQRGSAALEPTPTEARLRREFRRSIVAARDLPAGTVLGEADLAYRRPGDGMKPYECDRVLGRTLHTARQAGAQIREEDLA